MDEIINKKQESQKKKKEVLLCPDEAVWSGRKYTLFGMRSSDWNIDLDKNVSSVNLFFSDETSLADWLNEVHVIFMEVPIP